MKLIVDPLIVLKIEKLNMQMVYSFEEKLYLTNTYLFCFL